jgi:ribosomal-protein-alanine N-acetyltransferase
VSVIERLLRRDAAVAADSPVTIAPMRRRDVGRGVMAIESVSYPRPWSKAVFESELAQVRGGSRWYVVARQRLAERGRGAGDEIVGYAGLWFTDAEAHVTNIAVRPARQRRGVATRLMSELADEAIRRGATAWTLEVRASSVGAQELYRRFGFVPAGVRTRYYENTEDAIVMWCSEIQSDEYAALLASIRATLTDGTARTDGGDGDGDESGGGDGR